MSRKKAVSEADPAVERPEVDEIYEKLLVHAKLQARQMAELLASKTRPRDVLGETEYRLRDMVHELAARATEIGIEAASPKKGRRRS